MEKNVNLWYNNNIKLCKTPKNGGTSTSEGVFN